MTLRRLGWTLCLALVLTVGLALAQPTLAGPPCIVYQVSPAWLPCLPTRPRPLEPTPPPFTPTPSPTWDAAGQTPPATATRLPKPTNSTPSTAIPVPLITEAVTPLTPTPYIETTLVVSITSTLTPQVVTTITPPPTLTPTPGPTLRAYDKPGPYGVGQVQWEAGTVAVADPRNTTQTLGLRHFGVTYYPVAPGGGAQAPVAFGGPFPLVVWGHARYQSIDAPNTNHFQTDYLLRHLASWGYVATSVNLDGLGIFNEPPAIAQRAELLLATIAYHLGPQAGGGRLTSAVDGQRIALAGLSRGGEAAALAAMAGRYPVRAVSLFAPTDSQAVRLAGLATQIVYGSCDGDVVDGAPVRVYERSGPPKQLLYIYGANHYNFTESLDIAPCMLSRSTQHSIAQTALTTFLASVMGGDTLAAAYVRGDRWPLPGLANANIYPSYQDPTRLDVDTFEDEPWSVTRNSLEAGNATQALNAEELPLESLADTCLAGGYTCNNCLCLVPHPTRGLHVTWSHPLTATAAFTATLPAVFDASGYTHLAFRAASRMRPRTAPLDQPQDVRIVLLDADGRQASLSLGATGQLIPYPYHPPIIPNVPARSQIILAVMRGVRLPLADFAARMPGLRLDRLTAIGLHFPAPMGELEIDDLGFTR